MASENPLLRPRIMEPGTNTSQQNTIYKTIGMALELAKEGHSEGVLNLLLSILPPPFGTNTAITPSDSELEFDRFVYRSLVCVPIFIFIPT